MGISAWRLAHRHGLVIHKSLKRLARIGLRIEPYCVILEGADARRPPSSALAARFPASIASREDVGALIDCGTWATREQLESRFDRGHLCVVVKDGNRVAGYTWVDPAEMNHAPNRHPLAPGEAYLYDAYVSPDMRGAGLAPHMRTECYLVLERSGYRRFYSVSEYFNTPAIRFKMKLGACIMQVHLTIKLGKRQFGPWLLRDYRPQSDPIV